VEAVNEEVEKLKQAGAIKEVFYPYRLANTVVIKKKNGKWRVYVDFTNLTEHALMILTLYRKLNNWWIFHGPTNVTRVPKFFYINIEVWKKIPHHLRAIPNPYFLTK